LKNTFILFVLIFLLVSLFGCKPVTGPEVVLIDVHILYIRSEQGGPCPRVRETDSVLMAEPAHNRRLQKVAEDQYEVDINGILFSGTMYEVYISDDAYYDFDIGNPSRWRAARVIINGYEAPIDKMRKKLNHGRYLLVRFDANGRPEYI